MGYREIHFSWAEAELLIPLDRWEPEPFPGSGSGLIDTFGPVGAIARIWEKCTNLRILGFHPGFSTYYDDDTKEAHGDFNRLIYQLEVRDVTTGLQKTVTWE